MRNPSATTTAAGRRRPATIPWRRWQPPPSRGAGPLHTLMTAYLTDSNDPAELERALRRRVQAPPTLYPPIHHQNSAAGEVNPTDQTPGARTMEAVACAVDLMAKSPTWTVDIFDREDVFLERHLQPECWRGSRPERRCWSPSPPPMPWPLCRTLGPQLPPTLTPSPPKKPPARIQNPPQKKKPPAQTNWGRFSPPQRGGKGAPFRRHATCLPGPNGNAPAGLRWAATSATRNFFLEHRFSAHPRSDKDSAVAAPASSMPPMPWKAYAQVFEQEATPGSSSSLYASEFRPRFYGPEKAPAVRSPPRRVGGRAALGTSGQTRIHVPAFGRQAVEAGRTPKRRASRRSQALLLKHLA